LVAVIVLSTSLSAQYSPRSGGTWFLGLAATLGSGWQIEGADLGLARRIGAGPVRALGVAGRFGSFINEGAILGGAQGFIAALALSARSGRLDLAQMGPDNNPTTFGLDLTVELAGWLGSSSPLAQRGRWTSVAVLPGLRFGSPDGGQWSLVVGPTAFLGHPTDWHGFLGIRFEAPLARREHRP
jgi:hypothetical protein